MLSGEDDSSSELCLPAKRRRVIRLSSSEDDNSSDKIAESDKDNFDCSDSSMNNIGISHQNEWFDP